MPLQTLEAACLDVSEGRGGDAFENGRVGLVRFVGAGPVQDQVRRARLRVTAREVPESLDGRERPFGGDSGEQDPVDVVRLAAFRDARLSEAIDLLLERGEALAGIFLRRR
ncbi:hypothetical protein Aph01nite_35990 [Acrocarpospora phusangensis]|uniref:Uncharacterized protein n=1 Tax=Acrocarpospora phusangensis TaxID=1070424 RepID=A0A919QA09_9ACTN|nr:hypothetical protein Aph01nite_35990 [Acrocarpospora phusangensis]